MLPWGSLTEMLQWPVAYQLSIRCGVFCYTLTLWWSSFSRRFCSIFWPVCCIFFDSFQAPFCSHVFTLLWLQSFVQRTRSNRMPTLPGLILATLLRCFRNLPFSVKNRAAELAKKWVDGLFCQRQWDLFVTCTACIPLSLRASSSNSLLSAPVKAFQCAPISRASSFPDTPGWADWKLALHLRTNQK
jgi:hypothetical protein